MRMSERSSRGRRKRSTSRMKELQQAVSVLARLKLKLVVVLLLPLTLSLPPLCLGANQASLAAVAVVLSPNNPSIGTSHQEHQSTSDTSSSRISRNLTNTTLNQTIHYNWQVDAALASNPILPQALPLGHLEPVSGIENHRKPPTGGHIAGAQLETTTRGGRQGGGPANSETQPSSSRPETKDTARGPLTNLAHGRELARQHERRHRRHMIDGSPMAAGDNAPPTGHSKGGADSFATGQLMMDRRGKLASEDRGGSSDVAAVEINAANLVQRSSKMADNTVNRGEHVPSVSSSLIGLDERRRFGHKMIRSSGSGGGGNLDSSANELLPDQQEQQQEHQKQEQQRTDGSQSAPQLTSLVEMTPASRRNRRLKCRVEKDLYLDFEEYQHYTCAHCYNQVPPEYFNNKLGLVREEGRMIRLEDRESEQPIWTNETARIKLTFKVEEKFEKWQICCRQAVECCQENAKYLPTTVANDPDNEDDDDTDNNNANHNNDELPLVDDPKRNECPGTWDGLSCWGPSAAGRLAWRECPRVAYLLDFEPACRGYVTKQCFQNASWFINRNGHEWSDYSACSPEGLYKARMLHASVAYVCEALIVVPALLIIGKFPNRGGNKRIRIMKSLLFYILLNSLIQALQRGFLAAGYFAEYRGGPHRVEHHSSSRQQLHQSQQEQQQQQQQQQRQLLLDQRQEQPAVPTKLALISSEGPQQNAARNELIPSSLTSSASLIDQQARSGGGGNDGETGPFERQTRLHARSAGSVELDDAMTTSLTELPRDNGVDETNYYEDLDLDNDEDANEETETETEMEEQNDPGGQYDGSELDDDDDDDDQNELVERIFLTAPKRPFAQPIRLDGGRHHRVVGVQIDQANRRLEDNRLVAPRPTGWPKELEIFGLPSRTLLNSRNGVRSKLSSQSQSGDHISSKYQLISTQETDPKLNNNSIETNYPATATEQDGSDQEDRRPLDIHVPRKEATETPTNTRRHKRNSTTTTTATTTAVTTDNNNNNSQDRRFQPQIARFRRKESAWKAFFCWFLQMASRLVRLMSYAWMFTGGVYLCSALHFAPAEPPAKFIKILFFLTNAFPNLIFFAYVTARTINEPSPLNIIIKAPYYWFRGDEKQIEQLYETQKVCWFEESKSQSIEDIADLPNLILVAANVALFVITLVILCRINRPGSTRPDMSPCAYFKAAGTLLFLYGGHYFFLAYRPESESCSVDTFMFYAFICIDVVQGIAISIVFCYMTQEGKSVIVKYWRNRHRFTPFKQLRWLSCFGDKYKLADNGYHHTPYNAVRLNHSLRSNTSACNGHNDNVTELVNINDTQVSGHF